MANLTELESAIYQLPESEIRQLIARLQNYVRGDQKQKSRDANLSDGESAIPIWKLAAKISAMVPDEEWQKLPTDLAEQFDYYQTQEREESQ